MQTGESSMTVALSLLAVYCFVSITGRIPTCAREYPDDLEKLSSNRREANIYGSNGLHSYQPSYSLV
eukprot:scaffold14215_cov121-Skeletonema_menzelii.AAC.1